MKSPFASINVVVLGAAIFAIIIATAIVLGTSYTATAPQVSAPKVARGTVSTSRSATSTTSNINSTSPLSTTTSTSTLLKSTTLGTTTVTSSPSQPLTLSISPSSIEEGDPVMISIVGKTTAADIQAAVLIAPGPNAAGKSAAALLHFLTYENTPVAFYGTGINQTPGTTTVTVTLKNGTKLSANFTIAPRTRPSESLPVPAQLGGNSTSSQEQLLTNLDAENAELDTVYSNPNISFWTSAFSWPIHSTDVSGGIVITDPFGYNRDSGAETIIHKGSDFKAPPGTPVYAINAGYVRVTKLFSVYGNTVIVDHGMGIESFYMHLSKMSVTPGEAVKKGQLLGYSGETGYSEGPHLHLTIRIGGISIDPIQFYALFGLKPDTTLAN